MKYKLINEEREGLCFINKYGESYVVLEHKCVKNVKIKFKNGYEKFVRWEQIIKDNIKSPYSKSIYSVGFVGEGKYNKKNIL